MKKIAFSSLALLSLFVSMSASTVVLAPSVKNYSFQVEALSQEAVTGILTEAAIVWKVSLSDLELEYNQGSLTIEPLGNDTYRVTRGGGEVILVIWND